MARSVLDTLRVFATVGFLVLQFNTVKKQFAATRKVPVPDDDFLEMLAR